MRNIVGQTPRGDDFFRRDKIVDTIYRRLNAGAHIYLAAPRRVGKTAIMRHLEDRPRKNYEFKYIITESVDNASDFFEGLLESLKNSENLLEKSRTLIVNLIDSIRKIQFAGAEVDFERKNVDYFNEFKKLIKELKSNVKIVIMIDEFPQTVENILRKHGHTEAEQFLQFNREIRSEASENIRFLMTGSIGLPSVAEKLRLSKEIADLNIIEVPPLDRKEAQQLITLLLDSAKIPYDNEVISYSLDAIAYFVPFHLQLLVQELIDAYFNTEEKLTKTTVDVAFKNILNQRNDIYFAHYYTRLMATFSDEKEYHFALAVLKALSRQEQLTESEVKELANAVSNYSRILNVLEFDGYIFSFENRTVYRFTSPVLKLWWKNYVR